METVRGTTVLLAFGFGNLAMLGWLAVAAAPLIIHLWNRRKYRELRWAAVEYLLAAMRRTSRRVQVEQWILLAIRTLLIVCLVLALAEPYLERAGLGFLAGRHVHKVLVIDGSYSMDYKPSDVSRFQRAKELAVQIVEESRPADGFTLVVLGEPPRVVVGSPAFEAGDFIEEVENLQQPHTGGDLAATLEKVDDIVARARREHPRLAAHEVYFLTDLGRTTWLPDLSGREAHEAFQRRSQQLSKQAHLVIVDLGQPQADNVAVTALRAGQPLITLDRDVTFEAQLQNFGRQAKSRQLVELLADGRRVGEAYVDLPAGGQAWATFRHRFETHGTHALTAQAAPDLLSIDNRRFLSAPVKESLQVLCVNGKPAGGAFQGATDYLRIALAPQSGEQSQSVVRPEVVPETALLETDLGRYDVVALCNVGQFTAQEASVLLRYVTSGGALAIFLGDQVQPESYNRHLLGDGDEAARLLPAKLAGRAAEGTYHLNPLEYRHPLVREFEHQERAGLLTALVWQYQRLELAENGPAKMAMAFQETGEPALVEQPLGRGRVYLWATSADVSWTTLPAGPAFLPLVQELLTSAVEGQGAELNVRVGQSLSGSLRTLSTDVPMSLQKPDGAEEPLRLQADGDDSHWAYAETWESGLYEARLGAPLNRRETYAVNVDTRESDLTQLDPAELRDTVWSGVAFEHRTNWQDLIDRPDDQIARRGSLHRGLLLLVMTLIVADSLCGYWFGRSRL